MPKLSEIDKNFKVETKIEYDGLKWFDASSDLFSLHGLLKDDEGYKRMDSSVAKATNEGVFELHRHTSGGRITFETTSPYIAIHAKVKCEHSHVMSALGACGFDMYEVRNGEFEYVAPFFHTDETSDILEGQFSLGNGSHKVVIHFPLYAKVEEVFIGLDGREETTLYSPYKNIPPVVYYGSSITQGGCASRPGNNYPAIVSQKTFVDFHCLGFSGSAHGEQIIADYIASLPMSVFVLDYDHNDCDNREAFYERHERFYKTIRAAHPDIPIIIMSAPYAGRTFFENHVMKSYEIVHDTYLNAKKRGENVYMINGGEVFGEFKNSALNDRIHPNDFGFGMMAQAVLKVMKEVF